MRGSVLALAILAGSCASPAPTLPPLTQSAPTQTEMALSCSDLRQAVAALDADLAANRQRATGIDEHNKTVMFIGALFTPAYAFSQGTGDMTERREALQAKRDRAAFVIANRRCP